MISNGWHYVVIYDGKVWIDGVKKRQVPDFLKKFVSVEQDGYFEMDHGVANTDGLTSRLSRLAAMRNKKRRPVKQKV